jgi:hypothetical protein
MPTRRACLPLAVVLLAGCACPPPQPSSSAAGGPPPPDTLRGLVVVVRTADQPAVLLRPTGSAEVIPLNGSAVAALRDLEGFEVRVAGMIHTVHAERSLADVADFRVLAVEGQPVRDGRLSLRGDSLFVTDSAGTASPIVSPSPILRHDIDRRVWIAGPIDKPPTAFGVVHVTAPHDLRSSDACFDPRRPRRGGRPPD